MHGCFIIKISIFCHENSYDVPWFQHLSMKMTAWKALVVHRFGFQYMALLTLPSCMTLGKLCNLFGTWFFYL